ncbi:MAG: hypothetical protein NTU57_01640 [Candidatus Aenigmarchaeota archaeon]|nr:hypothetical protein [Candidatus Aenigmarchaeota archaeon]
MWKHAKPDPWKAALEKYTPDMLDAKKVVNLEIETGESPKRKSGFIPALILLGVLTSNRVQMDPKGSVWAIDEFKGPVPDDVATANPEVHGIEGVTEDVARNIYAWIKKYNGGEYVNSNTGDVRILYKLLLSDPKTAQKLLRETRKSKTLLKPEDMQFLAFGSAIDCGHSGDITHLIEQSGIDDRTRERPQRILDKYYRSLPAYLQNVRDVVAEHLMNGDHSPIYAAEVRRVFGYSESDELFDVDVYTVKNEMRKLRFYIKDSKVRGWWMLSNNGNSIATDFNF